MDSTLEMLKFNTANSRPQEIDLHISYQIKTRDQ
nr:MAG TPA: hypothetical protein [Caudoviricetes sp.]